MDVNQEHFDMPDISRESMETVLYRIAAIEVDFKQFKEQLKAYDTARENDLKLERINDTASRVEVELRLIRSSLEDINARMVLKEGESKQRDTDQSAAQDRLQIKVLVSILSTVIIVVSGLLVFYITHK